MSEIAGVDSRISQLALPFVNKSLNGRRPTEINDALVDKALDEAFADANVQQVLAKEGITADQITTFRKAYTPMLLASLSKDNQPKSPTDEQTDPNAAKTGSPDPANATETPPAADENDFQKALEIGKKLLERNPKLETSINALTVGESQEYLKLLDWLTKNKITELEEFGKATLAAKEDKQIIKLNSDFYKKMSSVVPSENKPICEKLAKIYSDALESKDASGEPEGWSTPKKWGVWGLVGVGAVLALFGFSKSDESSGKGSLALGVLAVLGGGVWGLWNKIQGMWKTDQAAPAPANKP